MIGEPTNIFDHDDEAGTDVEFSWSALPSIAAAYSLPGDTGLRGIYALGSPVSSKNYCRQRSQYWIDCSKNESIEFKFGMYLDYIV